MAAGASAASTLSCTGRSGAPRCDYFGCISLQRVTDGVGKRQGRRFNSELHKQVWGTEVGPSCGVDGGKGRCGTLGRAPLRSLYRDCHAYTGALLHLPALARPCWLLPLPQNLRGSGSSEVSARTRPDDLLQFIGDGKHTLRHLAASSWPHCLPACLQRQLRSVPWCQPGGAGSWRETRSLRRCVLPSSPEPPHLPPPFSKHLPCLGPAPAAYRRSFGLRIDPSLAYEMMAQTYVLTGRCRITLQQPEVAAAMRARLAQQGSPLTGAACWAGLGQPAGRWQARRRGRPQRPKQAAEA